MGFKFIELFAGVGGFRQALDELDGECVFASEIDPFAVKAYRALYDGAAELHGDITKIEAHDIPDHDVLVGGFPCQAFSVAGQRKGFEEARGTLFFEIARIASAKQPRLMLLENVKGLLSHDGGKTFETMCTVLNDIGYAIDFRVLNSKHYGVPQNRERIFICASRDAEHSDWIVSGNGVEAKAKRRAQDLGIRTFNFDWPTNDTVTTRLRDILETNVDERYYLSEEKTAKVLVRLESAPAALIANIQQYSEGSGISYTIDANYAKGTSPGDIGKGRRTHVLQGIEYSRKSGIGRELDQAHCLSASDWRGLNRNQTQTAVLETSPRYRIRKLTPLECWRLQGFSDEAHNTVAAAGVSDSQRYKQAGNAVTVNVIRAIGERLVPLLGNSEHAPLLDSYSF
ncbi:DNA (cytosine-5-)-methyltransferase [Paenibacillus sp. sgz302251]|uniref:DNA (cytosine-5-)-methyltransferase n=1 Tax=Paenibacillus sp. sgz302251 TaxID=3414493 RepID=UPI003C7A4034